MLHLVNEFPEPGRSFLAQDSGLRAPTLSQPLCGRPGAIAQVLPQSSYLSPHLPSCSYASVALPIYAWKILFS